MSKTRKIEALCWTLILLASFLASLYMTVTEHNTYKRELAKAKEEWIQVTVDGVYSGNKAVVEYQGVKYIGTFENDADYERAVAAFLKRDTISITPYNYTEALSKYEVEYHKGQYSLLLLMNFCIAVILVFGGGWLWYNVLCKN